LHLLVREVAATRAEGERRERVRGALVAALAVAYPVDGYENPAGFAGTRGCGRLQGTAGLLSAMGGGAAAVPWVSLQLRIASAAVIAACLAQVIFPRSGQAAVRVGDSPRALRRGRLVP